MSIETSDSCSTTCTATSQSKSARPTLVMPERNSTRLRCAPRWRSDRIYRARRLRLRLDSSARDGKGSLASLVSIVLQQRALYQACLFGAFSLFWTTVPLLLTGSAFHMSQGQVALFALVGAAASLAAPLAGGGPRRA